MRFSGKPESLQLLGFSMGFYGSLWVFEGSTEGNDAGGKRGNTGEELSRGKVRNKARLLRQNQNRISRTEEDKVGYC